MSCFVSVDCLKRVKHAKAAANGRSRLMHTTYYTSTFGLQTYIVNKYVHIYCEVI